MAHLPEFSGYIIVHYRVNKEPNWSGRPTPFLAEVYTGDILDATFKVVVEEEQEAGHCSSTKDNSLAKLSLC